MLVWAAPLSRLAFLSPELQRRILTERQPASLSLQAMRKTEMPLAWVDQVSWIEEVDEGIWLVSFMRYDLGYIDLEQKTLQTLDNPFGPRLSPMS